MTIFEWVLLYAVSLVFWLWVIKGGGAERLESTLTAGFVVSIFATRWSADGIKLFAGLILVVKTVWFFIGLFNPSVRSF